MVPVILHRMAGTIRFIEKITYRNLFGFSQSDRIGGSTDTYTVIVGYQSGRMVHQVSVSAQIAMLEVGSVQDHDFIRLVEDPAIADLGGRGKYMSCPSNGTMTIRASSGRCSLS